MPKVKKKKDLSQKVMKEIAARKVKMRPKIYFVAGSIFLGVGFSGAMTAATFFANFFFFRLRLQSPFGHLKMGRFGLKLFLFAFPWWPLLIAVAGIIGGLALLRRYEVSYKKSFLGLAIALITFIFFTGFLLHQFGFNKRASRIRPLRPLYKGWVTPMPPKEMMPRRRFQNPRR